MKENVEMMYDVNEAVRSLNKIDGFEPKDYLRKEESEDGVKFYLDTKYRLLWYRLAYKKGKIVKIPKVLAKDHATFEVRIYADTNDAPDNFLANGFASRYMDEENKEFGMSFVESAETAALGRALKDAGFGTQFCDVALPNDERVVDAGVNISFDLDNSEADNPDADGIPAGVEAATEEEKNISSLPKVVIDDTEMKPVIKKEEKKPIQLTPDMSVEALKKYMTVAYAKSVTVSVGFDSGRTLGDLAVKKPKSIEFHASRGENNLVKVAAQLLLDAARKTA